MALQDELAAEKAKKKALQRALEAAAKMARGRNIQVDQGRSGGSCYFVCLILSEIV